MDIINFPGGMKPEPVNAAHRMLIGPVDFSCPQCAAKGSITFKEVVFRTVEFYCGGCGSFFKVTNPAFTPSISRPPTKRN